MARVQKITVTGLGDLPPIRGDEWTTEPPPNLSLTGLEDTGDLSTRSSERFDTEPIEIADE